MKDKIFKTTLDNQGEYDIRLLPNINDYRTPKISFKGGFGLMGWIYNHISYALVNGDIKIWVYSDVVQSKFNQMGSHNMFSYWDVVQNKYIKVKTSDKQGFLKVDIDFKKDKKYNFNKNRKYIEDLFETIRHIKLEDVLYQQLFSKAEMVWDDNYMGKEIKMYDVYCQDYSDFEERYNIWLRSKKIKQIIG